MVKLLAIFKTAQINRNNFQDMFLDIYLSHYTLSVPDLKKWLHRANKSHISMLACIMLALFILSVFSVLQPNDKCTKT